MNNIYKEKKKVADDLFDGRCDGCKRSYGRGFAYHHKVYVLGEKTYRDFKDTVSYNRYLLPIVRQRPRDFSLLCKQCHHVITRLSRYHRDKFDRIVKIVNESR